MLTELISWRASQQLEEFLSNYYVLMSGLYKILYGSSFQLPYLFLEDTIVSDVPLMSAQPIPALFQLTEIDANALQLCGEDRTSVFRQKIERFGHIFLLHFRRSSFYKVGTTKLNHF
jgi:hypothetical protein